jgi:hypothetical protein
VATRATAALRHWAPATSLLGVQRRMVSSQELLPRGNMKAACSVNDRDLPGGGGLWLCMRRPQQIYKPRGMGVRARALRCIPLRYSRTTWACCL